MIYYYRIRNKLNNQNYKKIILLTRFNRNFLLIIWIINELEFYGLYKTNIYSNFVIKKFKYIIVLLRLIKNFNQVIKDSMKYNLITKKDLLFKFYY